MVINWITNVKMKNLLEYISFCPDTKELISDLHQLKELLLPPFKRVKDCIIISEKSMDKLEGTFDKMLNVYMDKTGYEASNTETRINCYFENEISMVTGTQIALVVLEMWSLQLKQMEPDSKFCLIICSDENHVEIRFHKMHDGESMWLTENLECYEDEAVGYALI